MANDEWVGRPAYLWGGGLLPRALHARVAWSRGGASGRNAKRVYGVDLLWLVESGEELVERLNP